METQVHEYLEQYRLAETVEQKQILSAQFATLYDSLSADDKRIATEAMQPSLLELKAWTEREIDPLITRANDLLTREALV